jgi:hypothetical protein
MQISSILFNTQFSHFKDQIAATSGEPFRSFQEGLPSEWEDYKQRVWHEAQEQLELPWQQQEIGTGEILRKVVAAIEIKRSKTLRNNLVAWDGRRGPDSRSHVAFVEASQQDVQHLEQWAYDFYVGEMSPEAAFETLGQLAGKRYDLVAYLFFLKNRHKYLPIGTKTFDKAFAMLGVDLVTTRKCSWENYSRYVATIADVQKLLRDVGGISDASLLDAHSFCWMLARLEAPAPTAIVVPTPRALLDLAEATQRVRTEPASFEVVTEQDFVEREERQRLLGRMAQDVAVESEVRRLTEAGHPTASKVVKPVWDEPARGYDILSAEPDGSPRHIEVKAARHAANGQLSFVLSANELRKSRSLQNYWFYLIVDVTTESPDIVAVPGDKVLDEYLTPMTFEASFRPEQ